MIKTPHFFKAKSRLGCTNVFFAGHEFYSGVENGPEAILTEQFLSQIPPCQITDFIFSKPEEILIPQFMSILVKSYLEFKNIINQNLISYQLPIVIGGDHSVSFASISATLERIKQPQKLGYIQIDSHGDLNRFATSPSKNFHGMYLRALTDNFDIPDINQVINFKLPTSNILFIGNLNLDSEEKVYFQKQKIWNINGTQIQQNQIVKKIDDFIKSFPNLHVSLDIDVFDKKYAPATGLPCPNGLSPEDVLPIVNIISRHPGLSFDLCEVNPQKEGSKQTIELAQQILLRL